MCVAVLWRQAGKAGSKLLASQHSHRVHGLVHGQVFEV